MVTKDGIDVLDHDPRQIDLEEAIAASRAVRPSGMTVAEYVEATGWPEWRVRMAIRKGVLVANDSIRPMVITGGEMPLTVQEWQRVLDPEVRKLRPGIYSWSDGGRRLSVLGKDSVIRRYQITSTRAAAQEQAGELARVPCARKES